MSWHRLLSAGAAPLPIDVGLARGVYLVAHLVAWLESRPLAQRRTRKGGNATTPAA